MRGKNILLLTGGTGSGKTMTLKKILSRLESSGIPAGGMLAPGRFLASGEKEFDLELIPGPDRYFLSTRIQYTGWQAIGGFRFNPEAVEAGLRHLRSLPQKQFHLYLLDEIGPFELDGLLWAPVIPDLLETSTPMIWTVRTRIVDRVREQWNLDESDTVLLKEGSPDKAVDEINTWMKGNIQGLS